MAKIEQAEETLPSAQTTMAQMLTLLSGSFASGFDAAAASMEINRREMLWLDARGIDDAQERSTLEARIAETRARAEHLFATLVQSAATPQPVPDAFVVGGLVKEGKKLRDDVEVVALDRRGHALEQAATGSGGAFSIRLDSEADIVLMVMDAHGKRLHVDEEVIAAKPGSTRFKVMDIATGKGPRRERADLGDRVTMRDLAGMNVKEAADSLRDEGFENIEVTLDSRRDSDGVVVGSDPRPGSLIELSRRVELTVGKDPDTRFDRDVVASVVKVETGDAVPDPAVDRMFETLAAHGMTGLDRLRSAARRDDRAFAELSGLPLVQAAAARKSLLKTVTRLGALRDQKA